RTGADALKIAREHEPHILIMELLLAEVTAATVVRELRELRSITRTFIFTGSRNEAALIEALRAGPHGFVHKAESLPALWAGQRRASQPSLARHRRCALALRLGFPREARAAPSPREETFSRRASRGTALAAGRLVARIRRLSQLLVGR